VAGQLALIVEKSRLYQRLLGLNEQKNALLGVVAHDLRGPLAVVQGFVDVVDDQLVGPTTPQQHEVFLKIRRACQHMLALVNNCLDLSAIESGKLELDRREVDLGVFLREAHEMNALLASAKGISLELDVPATLPRVALDAARIGQVLNNLVGNALKFSYPKTTVTVRASPTDGGVAIAVQDQRQGIPAEELPRLFSPYRRGSARPTGGEKTTGLGLAIVKRMVEAHGGTIDVKSQVGRGTTITFTLPVG
jgi:hypothetical protein